jgi:hypothetical protein
VPACTNEKEKDSLKHVAESSAPHLDKAAVEQVLLILFAWSACTDLSDALAEPNRDALNREL